MSGLTSRVLILSCACVAVSFAVHADWSMHRKAGLWQSTMNMQGMPMGPQSSKSCIDAATDAAMMKASQNMAHCKTSGMHGMGNTWTMDAVCNMPNGMTSTMHSVTTFNGTDAYHTEMHTAMSPAPPGMKSSMIMSMDARWLGPCPGDMKPGDVVLGNGMKTHFDANMMGGNH
jgi:hypothetical protein